MTYPEPCDSTSGELLIVNIFIFERILTTKKITEDMKQYSLN